MGALRRFFHAAGPGSDGAIVLAGEEAHHAAQVIRLQPGDPACVLDGRGGEHDCVVLTVHRREIRLQLTKSRQHERPVCLVRLVPAITKGKSFELLLQKAVELGASEIRPLITDHVVARPAVAEFGERQERWQKVAVEAIKQCGSPWLPVVLPPAGLTAALKADAATELALVAALDTDARHLRMVFDEFLDQRRRLPTSVSIWIGPEGDFTAEELRVLRESGARAVTLGKNILRSETAAMYALSVLAHEITSPRSPLGSGRGRETSGPDAEGA